MFILIINNEIVIRNPFYYFIVFFFIKIMFINMIVHPYEIQVGTYIQNFHLKYVYIIGMGTHWGGAI